MVEIELELLPGLVNILGKLFKVMDLFELYKARLVCRLWNDLIDAEIKRRRRTSKVECTTISFPVDAEKSEADAYMNFEEKFNAWKRTWRAPPMLVLISSYMTFEVVVGCAWVPFDCVCAVIDGCPVCVDGINIESEGEKREDYETCNLIAFQSMGEVFTMVPEPNKNEYAKFYKELREMLEVPTLKFMIIHVDHDKRLILFKKIRRAVDEATKRGVVVLCSSSYESRTLANFDKHRNPPFIAICFVGEYICAASLITVDEGLHQLVEDWEKIERAQIKFTSSCFNHKNSQSGFCKICQSQTLGFLLSKKHLQYGYEREFINDPIRFCSNQEQDAFRYIIPNVPLFGWMDGEFIAGSNVNVDSAKKIKSRVLRPDDDLNFLFAVLIMRWSSY